jgi:vesicle coat complex subunit
MGNDMSPLFEDVIHFLVIPNLEVKKSRVVSLLSEHRADFGIVVYLFLVSYGAAHGRSYPQQTQRVIPSFQQVRPMRYSLPLPLNRENLEGLQ